MTNSPSPLNFQWERPPLYPKQEKAIFSQTRFACIEASTKAGKTHGCIIWLLEQAILNGGPDRTFYWIAPVTQQADTAWRRFKIALQPLIDYCRVLEGVRVIELWNGSRIAFKSADNPDSLYSDDVWAVVVDEASRCKRDTLNAVMSITTATGGPTRFIGNVRGKNNFFYEISRLAQSGANPDYSYFKLTAYDAIDAGVLDAAVIESARLSGMPEHAFRELYLAEASDLASNPFGLEYIQACVDNHPKTPQLDPVVYGWDLGKAMDFTAGIGLNEHGHVTQNIYHWQLVTWDKTIDRIFDISGAFPTYVDSTGLGDPVLDLLKARGSENFVGFKFTQSSKQQLIESLAISIQSMDITFPEGPLAQELRMFEYTMSETSRGGQSRFYYSAPEGYHDDLVMALALANKCRHENYVANPVYDIVVKVC